jgi:hypothetical protein
VCFVGACGVYLFITPNLNLHIFALRERNGLQVYSQIVAILCHKMKGKRIGIPLLGAFAKLRTASLSFVMPVCLSVRPHGTTRLPLDGISKILFHIFRKPAEKIPILLGFDKNTGTLMKTYVHF